MKDGGYAGEREIGDKNGGIETSIAFFLMDGFSTILIEEGIGFEDWNKVK